MVRKEWEEDEEYRGRGGTVAGGQRHLWLMEGSKASFGPLREPSLCFPLGALGISE